MTLTYKKAFDFLNELYEYDFTDDETDAVAQAKIELELLCMKAVKKQIPMKPTTFGKDLFDCAFCGRVLEKHSHNYCPKCGQKLDWSD